MSGAPTQSDMKTLKTKLGGAMLQLRHLPRVWALVWNASRRWAVAWISLLLVQGLIPVAAVYLTRFVVDGVVAAIDAGGTWESIVPVLWPAGLMAGVLLLTEVVGALLSMIREYQAELIQDAIANRVHQTSTLVDLAFYESPEYFDHLHRARNEAWYRPLQLVTSAGAFIQSTITLLAMAAMLLKFNVLVPLILLASTIPAFLVVVRHAIKLHRSRLNLTADERRAWYYEHAMSSAETAGELRLFGLGNFFDGLYKKTRGRIRSEKLRLLKQRGTLEVLAGAAALIAAFFCLGWMGMKTLTGEMSLGELALFYVAFSKGQQIMRSLLAGAGDIYRNVLFLGDLFEFLGLSALIQSPKRPTPFPGNLQSGIAFDDVTFSYTGSKREAISGFNLEMEAGKMVAIVGPNGSGKSTVMRLLCRLYDPNKGNIRIDGTNLKAFDLDALRHGITVLFQKPVQYAMTARENIALGDLKMSDGDGTGGVERAAESAGFDRIADKLPDGYDTLLGKWFEGGTELSFGEWQRAALARALLRRSPIVVLDEPTSAMDSWAESDWMARLKESVVDQTTMIITHRFTTAMRADKIHVMRDGRIIESGTHEELLEANGFYAESWKKQMASQK